MLKFNMAAGRSRTLHRYFLIMLMVMLAGCSSLRLAYHHGDTLLYWWLDTYIDVNASQKSGVKHDIDALFRWHRTTQLPDYIQLLHTAQQQLAGTPNSADLMRDYDEIKQRMQVLLVKAAPELATLARTLQADQIATLEKKFAANNAEFRKKNMKGDKEAQQTFRYKKSMEQFELWFGNFSSEQALQIRKASDARPLDNELWLDERLRRQRNILTLVRTVQRDKLNQEATMALIQQLLQDTIARGGASEHQAFFDAYDAATMQMILTVIKMATPAQKAHAQQRMQGWIDDFKQLAAESR